MSTKNYLYSRALLLLLGPSGYNHSSSSFLFSLQNKDKVAPFVANIKKDKENAAIYVARTYGPWFGNNDLLIDSYSNRNKRSYCNFGQVYQLPTGYFADSTGARDLLAGKYNFSTSEIEVFC